MKDWEGLTVIEAPQSAAKCAQLIDVKGPINFNCTHCGGGKVN